MIHKNCGGSLVIDCSSMYVIRSPSIKITSKGLQPGVIQIDSSKIKSSAKLMCSTCHATFSNKEEYMEGVQEICSICHEKRDASEIKFADNTGFVCIHCIKKLSDSKFDIKTSKDKLLLLYGEILSKVDSPTLLTILMKK